MPSTNLPATPGTLFGHRVYAPLLLLGRSRNREGFHMPVQQVRMDGDV
jgi:hypothetical protein